MKFVKICENLCFYLFLSIFVMSIYLSSYLIFYELIDMIFNVWNDDLIFIVFLKLHLN